MYVRLPMVEDWNALLFLIGEIRKALALDEAEVKRAFKRPPTITEEEFHELRIAAGGGPGNTDDDPENQRWNELCDKFIDWNDTPFYGTDEEWVLNIGPDTTLQYRKAEQQLELQWGEEGDWGAQYIIPLLMRIATLFPLDAIVSYSHLNVGQSLEVLHEDASIIKSTTIACSGMEARGDFITFILETATLYKNRDAKDLGILKEHTFHCVDLQNA